MTDCYGNQTDMGGTSMWWRVADSSKAAVNPTVGSVANVQGLDVGETQLIGEWYFDRWDAGPEDCQRSTFVEEDMAEMGVRPRYTVSGTILRKEFEDPDPPYNIFYRITSVCNVKCPVRTYDSVVDYGEFMLIEREYDAVTRQCSSRITIGRKPPNVSGCYERVGRL